MAVVFYRKHPGQDSQLQVRWIGELVTPVETLLKQPDFLRHLETFDHQTDALLRALASSLEELLAMEPQLGSGTSAALSADRLRTTLHNVLRVIFDVQRSRGKVREWFSTVDDATKVGAAQSLAGVLRKIEFLSLNFDGMGLQTAIPSLDAQLVASLTGRTAELEGEASTRKGQPPARRSVQRALRRLATNTSILRRLVAADRFVQAHLQTGPRQMWLERYRRVRSRIRRVLA
jgi:hypothetical protein